MNLIFVFPRFIMNPGEEGENACNPEWRETFDSLCQEAIRLGMELNSQYHTTEEIREIMGRLTGKRVDDTFRLFPPFYTQAAIFRIRAA